MSYFKVNMFTYDLKFIGLHSITDGRNALPVVYRTSIYGSKIVNSIQQSLFAAPTVAQHIYELSPLFEREGPRSRRYGRTAALRLILQSCDEDDYFLSFVRVKEHRWNEPERGKPKYSGKTCPSATLSTTNLTWTDPGSNTGLHVWRPAANRLSHGTALPLLNDHN
jgi:hypothetical protein